MNVFICWSGDRSRACAEALKQFLLDLNAALDLPADRRFVPFHSDDIDKGAAWFQAVTGQLSRADAAMLVVTPENAASPWMHFEAGVVVSQMFRHAPAPAGDTDGAEGAALAGRLFTYLFGFPQHERPHGPLSTYQATEATFDDTLAMVRSMLGVLDVEVFTGCWDRLAERLRAARSQPITAVCPELHHQLDSKTFREPLAECHRQEWLRRIAHCRDAHTHLQEHMALVEGRCSEYEAELFRQLLSALDAYEMAMDSHLVREEHFPIDANGRLELPQGIAAVCERRRRQVLDATAVLLDPGRAPVFAEAASFARLETSAERKHVIHRKSAAFRELARGRTRTSPSADGNAAARADWRKEAAFPPAERLTHAESSEWAFDRIMYYFAHREWRRWCSDDGAARALGLRAGADLDNHVCQWLEEELQKIRTSSVPDDVSRMPLSYALSIIEEMDDVPGDLIDRLQPILDDIVSLERANETSEVRMRATRLASRIRPVTPLPA